MCGIWGIVSNKKMLSANVLTDIMKKMMLLSESRGKEAAGVKIGRASWRERVYVSV